MMKIAKTRGHVIEKTRYYTKSGWEIDVFGADHEGLVMAEFEMKTKKQKIKLPSWLGMEVTSMKKFTNASLFKNGL